MLACLAMSYVAMLLACGFVATSDGAPPTRYDAVAPPLPEAATAQALSANQNMFDSAILVTIDTLRADALGVHGGLANTPVLDDLARTGWDFSRCISASMLTNPAHVSLMTSLYPRDHGVYDNESGISETTPTLATALANQGLYTVAVIGFRHLNPEVSGLGTGFAHVVRATRNERRAPDTTRAALEAIDEAPQTSPYFLWVHYTDPHAPYDPAADVTLPNLPLITPMSVALRAAPRFQQRNPWFGSVFRSERFVESVTARYYGEVEVVDRALGDLLAGLAERGRLSRTLVVITADHGENLGEHHLYFHHGGLYRETVHVPLILHGQGLAAITNADVVASVDVAPTILAALGVPNWPAMRGQNLVALMRGLAQARNSAFSEHMGGDLASLRTPEATLIVHRRSNKQFPSYEFTAGRSEFYDLRLDPGEQRAQPINSPVALKLQQQLHAWLEGSSPKPHAKHVSTSARDSLRALGYIE